MGDQNTNPSKLSSSIFGKLGLKNSVELTPFFPDDLAAWWPARDSRCHKYQNGHVLVIGGSSRFTGAPIMAAQAAASCGAGLVTVVTWQANYHDLVCRTPPYIMAGTIEELFTLPNDAKKALPAFPNTHYDFTNLAKFDSVVIGPGLGVSRTTQNFLQQLVKAYQSFGPSKTRPYFSGPWIVDADAFIQWPWPSCKHPIIYTPHLGEFARLWEISRAVLAKNIAAYWKMFADKDVFLSHVLVLKDSAVRIGSLKQPQYIWDVPNPALAKAGSGDILTGIMAALTAVMPQNNLPQVAALAVGIHGLMGKIAAERFGHFSPHAGDLLTCLPEAVKQIEQAAACLNK